MANCLTCKHNDRRAKMCILQDVHTDLGYVLNCAMWTPTDEAVIKQLKDENARLLDDNARLLDDNARLQEVVTDDELHMRKVLAENANLRELCADLYAEMIEYSDAPHYNASVWTQKLRDLGIDVAE